MGEWKNGGRKDLAMRVTARIRSLERKMGELKTDCPFCRHRPAEIWVNYRGRELPPPQEAPCGFCGKPPLRIHITAPLARLRASRSAIGNRGVCPGERPNR